MREMSPMKELGLGGRVLAGETGTPPDTTVTDRRSRPAPDPLIRGFRTLLVSAAADCYEPTHTLIERFRDSELPIEVVADDEAALRNPAALRKGTLLILHTPEMGWLRKADHGILANRPREWYLNPIVGCVYGCTYCYLLASPHGRRPLRFHVAVDHLINAIDRRIVRDGPDLLFSTGELADSLADARLFPIGAILAEAFACGNRGRLELRTKSANVEKLLTVNHGEYTTVAFSISPQEHVDDFEPGTASLLERVEAARRCQEAGYPVAFKFEPLILTPDWKQHYAEVLSLIARSVEPTAIDHVSVGCLRWSEELAQHRVFTRHHAASLADGMLIEYRPGVFNGTLNRADRLAAYEWMRQSMREIGVRGRIWWSLEEPDVVEEMTRRDRDAFGT